MIQAAINPETKEFLGLIIPKEDLDGAVISVNGTAADWERVLRGELISRGKVGVSRITIDPDAKVSISFGRAIEPADIPVVEVENLGGARE